MAEPKKEKRGHGVGVGPNPPTCTQAWGTYWTPATKIIQCYLQNVNTGQQYFPSSLSYGNNAWYASRNQQPPSGSYRWVVYGDDGSMAASNTLTCPMHKKADETPPLIVIDIDSNCQKAFGTYDPDQVEMVTKCVLVNQVTNEETEGKTDSGGGKWKSEFPPVDSGTYKVRVEGVTKDHLPCGTLGKPFGCSPKS
jgi:hypothetical protein